MRDEQQRSAEVLEMTLEPLDGVDVQVVGRLVEQQQVRLVHQRPAEQHASLPPAGQVRDPTISGQRQPREDRVDLVCDRPAIVACGQARGDLVPHGP